MCFWVSLCVLGCHQLFLSWLDMLIKNHYKPTYGQLSNLASTNPLSQLEISKFFTWIGLKNLEKNRSAIFFPTKSNLNYFFDYKVISTILTSKSLKTLLNKLEPINNRTTIIIIITTPRWNLMPNHNITNLTTQNIHHINLATFISWISTHQMH